MTDDRSLERAARSWLESGPTEAPDHAVEAALLRIQTTNQERDWHVPWRTRPMTQTTRLLAGAAAIAVVLLGGVLLLRPGGNSQIGGPSPSTRPASPGPSGGESPAAIPSNAASLDRIYASERYGYTVGYPSTWAAVPATKSWTEGTANMWGSGINDELKGTDIRFSGAAQLLAKGQTADQWLAAYAAGGDVASWPTVTIDGLPGRIDYDGGPASGGTIVPGGRMFDAVVVSGTFAFNFNMDGNVDRATFDTFLAAVKLPSLPSLDRSYTSAIAGYAIDHPKDWTVTPSSKAWTSGYDTQSVSDKIGTAPSIYATSTRLPAGTTFETWYAAYDADRAKGTCGTAAREENIAVDGVPGHLDIHCPTYYIEAVVSKGGRVYVMTMYTPYTRPLFESLLATVRLTPASAKN
jgi:hypothetical protein